MAFHGLMSSVSTQLVVEHLTVKLVRAQIRRWAMEVLRAPGGPILKAVGEAPGSDGIVPAYFGPKGLEMIGAEEWWRIIEAYGARIWAVQVVFYMVAVTLIGWLVLKPGQVQSWFTKLYFTVVFAWVGIVFFLMLAKEITGDSYGNYVFGLVFILVSVLFALDLFRNKMVFYLPEGGWRRYATLVLMAAVFCYPLFGRAFGHRFPGLIMPGTFPCPTTALGLLVLTTALPRVDKFAYILLLCWAIPFPPFIQIPRYGVYEDAIMFVSGIYSLVLLVRYWQTEPSRRKGGQG